VDLSQPRHRDGPVFGNPRLSPYRLGQRSFQAVVPAAYNRRCAITCTKISSVLQAAHVRPVSAGGEHPHRTRRTPYVGAASVPWAGRWG
jgi:putative restriction endonuclease